MSKAIRCRSWRTALVLALFVPNVTAAHLGAQPAKPRTDALGDPLPADALFRLGTLRHYVWSTHYQHLPDGKTLLFYRYSGGFGPLPPQPPCHLLWSEAATGRLVESWELPEKGVVCGVSPDGRLAVVCHADHYRLWDVAKRQVIRALTGNGTPPLFAKFSPDLRTVAGYESLMPVGFGSGRLRAWDVETGRELWPRDQLTNANWSLIGYLPDGKAMVVSRLRFVKPGELSFSIGVFDRDTGRELYTFLTFSFAPGKERGTWIMTPDGKTLLMGSPEGVTRRWDVQTGKELPPLKVPGQLLVFAPDGQTLLTTGAEPILQVRDWPAGTLRRQIDLGPTSQVGRLSISADGKRAWGHASSESAFRIFDLESGTELPPPVEGHRAFVVGMAVCTDGKAVSWGYDRTIRVWNLPIGRHLVAHTFDGLKVDTFAVSDDGRLVAFADFKNGNVALRERDSGRLLAAIGVKASEVNRLLFSPSGGLLAVAGTIHPGARSFVSLWETANPREIRQLTEVGRSLAFSPDGRWLATADRNQVRISDVATGREWRTLGQEDAGGVTFSPDGHTLAVRGVQGIILWELATAQERLRIKKDNESAVLMRFAPDGRHLATAGWQLMIRLWDARSGALTHTFAGHETAVPLVGYTPAVREIAFSPDGRALVSASSDTSLLVWDVAGVLARQPKGERRPTAEDVAAAWKDLSSGDPKAAYAALAVLAAAPEQCLALVREHVKPARALDEKQLQRWLAALASERFAEREQATRELARHAGLVEGSLERFLADKPTPEARRRVEDLLAGLRGPVSDPARLRSLRGLEVLEWIGTAEARKIVQSLAAGTPGAELTRAASATLERSKGRD